MELSVDWSRAQFALTAIYHFLFVPLTLGLSFIIAIMESIYVKTGNEEWKKITKFWLTLFGINFAIGVATGIIMEFEFGTNWANYSWFVGDIFGAPLAVEGILAFFLEATFFAVMFFGWNRVSKRFHLISTWLVAIGSNLSAFWILVANGWMQYPVGTMFNPDTARNEMTSFLDVALSPVAVSKFLHTVASGYVISALFVMGISAWYLLKGRHFIEAKKSLVVGASFGLLTSIFLFFSGDESAYQVTQKQPMKLAAMEGIYEGEHRAGLVAFGILNPNKKPGDDESVFLFDFTIPYALSILGQRDTEGFIAGIDDLLYGNEEKGIPPMDARIQSGQLAVQALKDYKAAKAENNTVLMQESKEILQANMHNFGYGYLENKEQAVPPVALTFYSFHLMVALGSFFFILFIIVLYLAMASKIEKFRKILWLCVIAIPLGYIAAEAGWIVAEVGRQPWAIQDLMPVHIAATKLSHINVQISFFIFLVLFTTLLIAELGIMAKQIKKGFAH
ncbi:cytochrome ubiquinol oxidase subunit I [Helicobacter winghamensis]|uniref:Cytochrome c oxidase subunit II n=1 Tax=Helicobacter winghamensis TaxID=157268 RepID=A0A2N3PKK0_9HELI|nr:cytochrome ubiquinol oxidase subunit I [Helicobacter winghamensis]EEO25997.1 cytochrome D ubiquinol oxidase subunit I [Helicobacter winghamensis ATCC BAA-430]PKT77007.1 cytochrome c oxidase subunit II [Helicobacter winghamensis]PKT77147.1 cytochrome c oxidase subunit II [Helicobacter winghamensis]PKT77707.1 cytochrome c oxidase subunit II [Helicobacter winghamensis]PKT81945.1 cytochrome c oxidase subunit II [Helicobacter winghamensis]